MGGFAAKLRTLVDDYPHALQDKRTLRSLLADAFPTDSEEVNLLMSAFEVGAVDLRFTSNDQLAIKKEQLQAQICRDYGIAENNASWGVETWMAAFGLLDPDIVEERDVSSEVSDDFIDRLKDAFDTMVVFKDLQQNNFISSFKLPSFMRDYVVKNFQNDDGEVDVDGATNFIRTYIPKKEDWKNLKNRIINNGETIKILAKVCVEINIRTGEISFSLPDFGLGYKDTTIPREVWNACSEALLKGEENWGIIDLGYQYPYDISLSFKNAEGEMLLHRLDLMGISVSTGSACDSKNTQISHVLEAIHVPKEYAKGTIRISLGYENNEEEVTHIAESLIKILKH